MFKEGIFNISFISATYTLNYGVRPPGTVSKTIYYKTNYYVESYFLYNSTVDHYTITLRTNYSYVYNIKFTVLYTGSIPDSEDGCTTWLVNKDSTKYKNGDVIDSGSIGDMESGFEEYVDESYDTIV